jgi:hypothetical protein
VGEQRAARTGAAASRTASSRRPRRPPSSASPSRRRGWPAADRSRWPASPRQTARRPPDRCSSSPRRRRCPSSPSPTSRCRGGGAGSPQIAGQRSCVRYTANVKEGSVALNEHDPAVSTPARTSRPRTSSPCREADWVGSRLIERDRVHGVRLSSLDSGTYLGTRPMRGKRVRERELRV